MIGAGARSAGTQHTLFTASANLPVVYMTWADGQGYKRFGPRGLLGTDALSNIAAAAICLFLIRRKSAEPRPSGSGVEPAASSKTK